MRWVAAAMLLGFSFAGDPLAGAPKCERAFIRQEVHRNKVRMTTSRTSEDAFVPSVQATLSRWRSTFRLFLVFNSMGPWQYDKCHTVLLLADGQRVPLGVATYEGFYLGGDTVSERIAVPLDGKALAQLGSVSRVELKVCNSEVKVPEELACTLHELACKVREWRSGGRNLEQCEPKPRPPVDLEKRAHEEVAPPLAPGALEPPVNASRFCGGHVTGVSRPDGTPGPHIAWTAYYTAESRESLVERYLNSLGSKFHAREGGCDLWRLPPDAPVDVLQICDASEKGPWNECSSLAAEAKSIIMISSMAGRGAGD